jgi:uncharacterized protein (DUF1697 family)
MTKYVALLRGIHPMNPNMRNTKIQEVFEKKLGFTNTAAVIASGNILFESKIKDQKKLETQIEKAIQKNLGFTSSTIVKSKEDLEKLVKANPFKGKTDSRGSQFNVTFLQSPPKGKIQFPSGVGYECVGVSNGAICTTIDLTKTKTPDLMTKLEKQFGKQITTRTWKTIFRILAKMEQ